MLYGATVVGVCVCNVHDETTELEVGQVQGVISLSLSLSLFLSLGVCVSLLSVQ